MNEYDEQRRSDQDEPTEPLPGVSADSIYDEPPGSHDQPQAPYDQPQATYDQPQTPRPGYPPQHQPHQPYPTRGYPMTPPPVFYRPAPPPPRANVAGWVWPLVAATALVLGLIGGTLGAVAVHSTMGEVTRTTIFESEDAAPAPLDPENRSVAAVADKLLPSTVQVLARGGSDGDGEGATGSGFVLDREGHVITNNHVVSDATGAGQIEVVDHEGRAHPARIVGRSAVYDIAVLRVRGAGELTPAALGSSQSMRVGETVVAIGSPLGLSSTVTSGIVSALDRPVTTGPQEEASFINAVQTDAAINPGNSGGPLVNMRGQVVGVNSAIATMGGFGGDAGNIGVGFAIPMEQVKVTAAQILQTGQAQYPVIGAEVDTGGRQDGAEVVRVNAGSPASRAGLEEGDVVVAVEGQPVTDGIGLIVAIRTHQPGETIALRVRRDGRELTVRVELDAKSG